MKKLTLPQRIQILGRDSNGTPIVFGDVTSTLCYRINYRDAKRQAERMTTGQLQEKLNEYYLSIEKLNPIFRFFKKIQNYISIAPDVLAYEDVLEEKQVIMS